MTTTVPIFDFHTPWVALIQIALMFVLPTLVGLVTDRYSASVLKVALLGGLTFATTLLTGLLDALTAGTPYDWVNAVLNALVTWGLAVAAYVGILKPSGAIAKVQGFKALQFIPADPARVAASKKK